MKESLTSLLTGVRAAIEASRTSHIEGKMVKRSARHETMEQARSVMVFS